MKKYLHEEKQIRVLALRGCTLALLDVMAGDVNTLRRGQQRIFEATDDDELTILVVAGVWYLGLFNALEALMNCVDKHFEFKLRLNGLCRKFLLASRPPAVSV